MNSFRYSPRTCFALIFLALATLPVIQAQARTILVPLEYNTIQTAIDRAEPFDSIIVSPGRYMENLNFNGKSLYLASTYIRSLNPNDIENTVIDGGLNGRSAIRLANGESGLICGFTIVNDSTDFGGGIYIRLGTVTVRNMIIEGCVASRNGGGIYLTGVATVTVHDVVLRNNRCGNVGGAMSIFTGVRATLDRVEMTGNYADHVGGALHFYGSNVTVTNCTIVNNAALHNAGAMYLTNDAIVTASNTIFWNNEPNEVWTMAGFQQLRFISSFNLVQEYLDRVFIGAPENLSWGVGNISDDPLFTNVDDGDFTLRENSPCIDAGYYESSPDHDGTRRDIGAHAVDQGNGGQRVHIHPGVQNWLQNVVDNANEGDIIIVYPGVYREYVTFNNRQITFASRLLSTGNSEFIASTIIDGDAGNTVIVFDGNVNRNMVFKGFTIQNGRYDYGGGIRCQDGTSPTLEDLVIKENVSLNQGGGIFTDQHSEPLIKRVQILNNSAVFGGGLAGDRSSPVLHDCVIRGNFATRLGAGIWGDGCVPTLERVLVTQNEADNQRNEVGGAGIHLTDRPSPIEHDIIFDHVTLAGNTVRRQNDNIAEGLGIIQSRSSFSVILTNSIIWHDQSPEVFIRASEGDAGLRLVVEYTAVNRDRIVFENEEDNERLVTWGEGNFTDNPLFNNPDAGDYSLSVNSPCIDTGNPGSEPDPDGTRTDMGAIYFHHVIERDPTIVFVPEDFRTIQEAIDGCHPGDTVIVAPGSYFENINFNGKPLVLASRYLLTLDPTDIQSTIIDGGGVGETVKFVRLETVWSKLIGFTITNGEGREGGGIFCMRTSPEIRNCVITGNHAVDGGGAIYLYGSSPALNNLTIVGNSSESGGQAIHMRNLANSLLHNSIVYGNGERPIVISADRTASTIRIAFSSVELGENAITLNQNGTLEWEEGNFADDPQFVDAEGGDFRLGENSPCIDTGDPEYANDPDDSQSDMGALRYIRPPVIEDFVIPLRTGWSLIGSPLIQAAPQMETIWQEQIETGELVLVKDMEGRFYAPGRNFNSIPGWVEWQGYAVKMERAGELKVTGTPLEADYPIPLRRGWSIISYHPTQGNIVAEAFADVAESILLVKDEMGRFYNPRYGYDNMGLLQRGKGYKILTSAAVDLVWGAGEELAGVASEAEQVSYQQIALPMPVVTDRNMSILFRLRESHPAEATSTMSEFQVAVLTEDGKTVGIGTGRLNGGELFIGVPVWGDDPTTDAIDGCKDGEPISVTIWQDGLKVAPTISVTEGEMSYSTDGFAFGDITIGASLPTEYSLENPFPNPFNSKVTLGYSLPQHSDVRFKVTDIAGRIQQSWDFRDQPAGRHSFDWNSQSSATGVYFVTMSAGSFKQTVKVALVK